MHAIGFSDKKELEGRYVDTSLDNFLMTMNISVYSFTAVAKRAANLMKNGGSMLTLTYLGAERVTPNYNVMGVAKAALETSVKYLAVDLGRSEYPRELHLGWAHQNARGHGHQRFPLYPEMERAELPPQAQHDD